MGEEKFWQYLMPEKRLLLSGGMPGRPGVSSADIRKMQWKVEKGIFAVEIGSSSEDICLNGEFMISDDAYVEGKSRGFYAVAVVE